jgi:SAM-dependent methyltransferase
MTTQPLLAFLKRHAGPLWGVLKAAKKHAAGTTCAACGRKTAQSFVPLYWPEIIAAMELTEDWVKFYDRREGQRCRDCNTRMRGQHLARTIVDVYNVRLGTRARSLEGLCSEPAFLSLRVAEINDCADLHPILDSLPLLSYSEYASDDPSIRHEDVLNLSYADDSFDLAIDSDSLEHVPDFERALAEIRRILKPGGMHIFTIPIVKGVKSRPRARVEGGKIVHLMPPVYHGGKGTSTDDYLAFSDFGPDVVDIIRRCGFAAEARTDPRNPALTTLVTTKD